MVELLGDPARCQVILVTLPEETPVNELVDTAYAVEDRAGVALGPIVVNGCVPPLDVGGDVRADAAAGRCRARRGARRTRWSRRPTSAPGWRGARTSSARASPSASRSRSCACPFFFTADVGPTEIELLADELALGIGALDDVPAR